MKKFPDFFFFLTEEFRKEIVASLHTLNLYSLLLHRALKILCRRTDNDGCQLGKNFFRIFYP